MFKDIFIGLFGLFSLIGVVSSPIYLLSYWSCDKYSETTGRETKFSAGICYIKDDNIWWSMQEFAARITAEKLK